MSSNDGQNNENKANTSIIQPDQGELIKLPTFRDPKNRPLHKLSVRLIETYRGINQV